MEGLEAADGDLRVAAAVHGPLVDVRAADDDVLHGSQACDAISRQSNTGGEALKRLISLLSSYNKCARCWRTSSSVIIIFECTCARHEEVPGLGGFPPAQSWGRRAILQPHGPAE